MCGQDIIRCRYKCRRAVFHRVNMLYNLNIRVLFQCVFKPGCTILERTDRRAVQNDNFALAANLLCNKFTTEFSRGNVIGSNKMCIRDRSYFHNEFTAPDVAKIMKRLYRNWSDELFSRYLGQFGIEPNKPIKSYSKGTKMKLSIATALAHIPKLLILDEATSGLDPVMRDEILDILLGFIQEDVYKRQ